MDEWVIFHEMLLKIGIIYPLVIGIIGFSIIEMLFEKMVRRERKYEQHR